MPYAEMEAEIDMATTRDELLAKLREITKECLDAGIDYNYILDDVSDVIADGMTGEDLDDE